MSRSTGDFRLQTATELIGLSRDIITTSPSAAWARRQDRPLHHRRQHPGGRQPGVQRGERLRGRPSFTSPTWPAATPYRRRRHRGRLRRLAGRGCGRGDLGRLLVAHARLQPLRRLDRDARWPRSPGPALLRSAAHWCEGNWSNSVGDPRMIARLLQTTTLFALAALPPTPRARQELAKQLANPVASLISVPFQFNYNDGIGADGDGHQSYVNIQPVIPFSLNENWNLISRTILPIVSQDGVIPGEGSQFGLGATTQSFFFSPKKPTARRPDLGRRPGLPAADGDRQHLDEPVGRRRHRRRAEAGRAVDGRRAGEPPLVGDRQQPRRRHLADLPPALRQLHDAEGDLVHAQHRVDLRLGERASGRCRSTSSWRRCEDRQQRVQFGVGARYWVEAPEYGPDGWGARAVVTLLFPK